MGGNTNRDSLWWGTRTVPGRPGLPGDLTTDVAIVGGGMTGITAAILLARAGRKVTVIEADQVGGGTSGGTSAHVTQVPDRRYHELISKFDEDTIRLVVESTRAGLEGIATFVAEEKIDCDFVRVPGYFYAEREKDVSQVEKELEAARKVGLAVARQDSLPLPFPVAAAVRYEDQARFHPLAYLIGLATAAERAGVQIFERTRVRGFETGDPCRIETDRGTAAVARDFVADRVKAPKLEDLPQVPVGEARVVDYQGEKVAVYHEAPGKLHAVAAVCTHLYCLVHWNSAEKTWDCPCHGGRYSPSGEVLEGPPVQNLKPVGVREEEPAQR